MTNQLLTEILKSLSILSILLLIGTFLRAKIKILQSLFLPASVIGGFIGLILSPSVFKNLSPIPTSYINIYLLLPGILVVPIFASIPLGMFVKNTSTSKVGRKSPAVIKMFAIFVSCSMFQSAIGYATNMFFTHFKIGTPLYRTFGYELSAGFSGGHGFASATGKLLEGFGVAEWATAQGVAITTATVGLLGGMIIGIILINIYARKGAITFLGSKNSIEKETKIGYYKDIEKQKSIGRETFLSTSIETIAFHLALIFAVCGLSYFILDFFRSKGIKIFYVLPVWTYSMIIMFFVNFIIQKVKLEWAIDLNLKNRITGALSEFAVISAIVSLPINSILDYILQVIVMMVLGFIATYIIIFSLTKISFKNDYVFERSIISFGTATGVLITGLMLLKISDSEYKTPALKDFTLGFSLMSLSSLITTPILNSVLATGSTFLNFFAAIITSFIFIFILLIFNFKKF